MVVNHKDTSLHFEELDHQSDIDCDVNSMDFGIIIVTDLDDEKL